MLRMIELGKYKTRRIYGSIDFVYPYLRYFIMLHDINKLKINQHQKDTAIEIINENQVNIIPNLIRDIHNCNRRFYYINIDIEINSGLDHSNAVIIDNRKKLIFLFDPYGYDSCKKSIYNQNVLLSVIQRELVDKLPGFYLESNLVEYKDNPGPQRLQKKLKRGGFCLMWGLLFICLRIKNPDVTYRELLEFLINPNCAIYTNKKQHGEALLEIIQRFTYHVNTVP